MINSSNLQTKSMMLSEGSGYSRLRKRQSPMDNEMKLSFRSRLLLMVTVLLVVASFVILVSVVSVKSRTNRLRKRVDHRKTVRVQEMIFEEKVPEFNIEEPSFNPRHLEADYCNGGDTAHYQGVLFTTLPKSVGKAEMSIAENTFKTWSTLKPSIKPVLYTTETMMKNVDYTKLIDSACREGFQVIFIQNSIQDQYPILGFMFETSYMLFNVTWYGYADYRQIFDSSLSKGLHMIEHYPELMQKGNLVMGRSHQFELDMESLSPDFPDLMDLGTLVQELYYFDATDEAVLSEDINYFFTTRRGFPWGKLPALLVNSDYLDKFLMWYTMKNTSILAVDATDAIFTLRQYHKLLRNGTGEQANPMKSYNEALISKWKHPLYYKKGLGTINCVEFKLTNSEMPYYVLSRRTRKYIRRVTKTRPPTLSYYCKIAKNDRVVLINGKGVLKDCQLVDQQKYLDINVD